GDLIVRVADRPIGEVADLRSALDDHAGETFRIEVVRDRERIELDVTLPEADEDEVTGPRAALAPRALPAPVTAPPLRPRPVLAAAPRVVVPPLPPRPALAAPGAPAVAVPLPRPAPVPRIDRTL
ncbi:MAG TPA: hypothetical protein VD788_17715, partial [Candidatus Polarisedimenticolaceae bacterium]|nr:hypothetical protein [Candidatus Polarisedimenticolaceae bacterium]